MKKSYFLPLICFSVVYGVLSTVTIGFGFFGTDYLFGSTPDLTEPKIYTVTLLHEEKTQTLPLEEYLYGVVAGEMPASFETEALKAQAVAARTYTVNRSRYPNKDHPEANVCSQSSHCKAYLTPAELADKFKKNPEGLEKIKQAVDATKHQIAVYNKEPISAVFHSTSSGMTENARDVWGGDLPYLVSVVSEGEEASPRYTETKTFSFEEFAQKINHAEKKVAFSGEPASWFSQWEKNESGSVKTVSLCGVSFKGTELRTLLGLRSTHFELSVSDQITITTKGNGHGVGMSQYGANDMAKKGYTYDQILKKYYTGIELSAIDDV